MTQEPKRPRGRPPGRTQTEMVRVYLTAAELAALDAARGQIPRSETMRQALEMWLRASPRHDTE